MSGFTGVKPAEFDTMTRKHTEAAGRLEELSQALHRELTTAGLDTTPALRLRELAARVTKQAEDLRRRQKLVHELQRQKVTFGQNPPSSNFVGMPDRLDDAQDLLDGTLAGRTAVTAAAGDEKALMELEKYASRAGDSEFAKAFLTALGPPGLTRLPASIAIHLRDAVRAGDPARQKAVAGSGRTILAMLGKALAKGTNPRDPAYMGDQYFNDLRADGRAKHPLDGKVTYQGYQAQALVWQVHDGNPPFSKEFMENIAPDVIIQERHLREKAWKVNDEYGWPQRPSPDLAGVLGLGTLLKPPGMYAKAPTESSMVEPLLRHAASSRELAQALLGYSIPGFKQTVLQYFLTSRMGVFAHVDDATLLGDLLLTATTGQDPTSKHLASQMVGTLSAKAREVYAPVDGKLEIQNRELLDRYALISYPLARAISANVDHLLPLHSEDNYSWQGVTPSDMSYALVLAGSNDKGFDILVRAQTEHTRAVFATVPPVGLNAKNAAKFGYTAAQAKEFDRNGNGWVDKSDTIQYLKDRAGEEGTSFNFIVETRQQGLIALGRDNQRIDEGIKTMVADAIGLLPVPGAKQVGTVASGAFGEIISKGYEHLVGLGYDKLAEEVAQRMSAHGRDLDEAYRTLADNRAGVTRLSRQLIATAALSKGLFDGLDLANLPFAHGHPPTIKPFSRMTSKEYDEFLRWTRERGGMSETINEFKNASYRTTEVTDSLGITKKHSPEDSQEEKEGQQ